MKIKKNLIFLSIILASVCLFVFSDRVNAATISDDGKYTLILTSTAENASIDGKDQKIIKFDVAEGETTVKLSELAKGIVPFNGRTEFSHWEKAGGEKVSDDIAITDFSWSGNLAESETYTNGLTLYARFSEKPLQGTGTYYLTLDPFAGKVNGQSIIKLTSKSTEFKTVDLTKYIPVREGYTFKGWELDGKIVTSIDSSYFAKRDCIEITATYTQDTFKGDGIVLKLNANGGKIDGKESNSYDYIGGGNSGTSMSLLPYIPVREGYTFNGWNTKKDGSGEIYNYVYWRFWDINEETDKEFDKDTKIKETNGYERYKNVTLYASWTKTSGEPEQPVKETVKEIQSTGETKAKIEFEKEVSKDYKLDIKPVEVKKDLTNKNVKYVVDINVLENNQIVKINDTKMKIRIALPEDLKGFNKYEIVYISNDEIKETIPATVEDGYIVFETTHLSEYGIIAKNVEQENSTDTPKDDEQKENTNSTNNISKTETSNPKTGDNIITNIILFVGAIIAIVSLAIVNKNRKRK